MPRVKGGSASDKKKKDFFPSPKDTGDGRRTCTEERGKPSFILFQGLHRQEEKKEGLPAPVDHPNQCRIPRTGPFLQRPDERLKKAGININRKMLSELAINDMAAFTQLAGQARNALGK